MSRATKRLDLAVKSLQTELVALRGLVQQANSDHAKERDELHRAIEALERVVNSRTEHLA